MLSCWDNTFSSFDLGEGRGWGRVNYTGLGFVRYRELYAMNKACVYVLAEANSLIRLKRHHTLKISCMPKRVTLNTLQAKTYNKCQNMKEEKFNCSWLEWSR